MENEQHFEPRPRSGLLLPLSILIAGTLVSGGLVYNAGVRSFNQGQTASVEDTVSGNPEAVRSVSAADHIRGDSNAPVKIITYEDTECPFCKRFHPTLQRLVGDYTGKVAWVYRHFPLESIHAKAKREAEATECAAELGGNESFWAYLDKIYEVTPSNDGLDPNQLPIIAVSVGLDRNQFEQCLASGRWTKKVEEDLQNAVESGGTGTPYTIIVGRDGKKYPVSGALPYEQMKSLVEQAL